MIAPFSGTCLGPHAFAIMGLCNIDETEQTEVRCDTLLPALENGLQLGDVVMDDAKYLSPIISSPATSSYGCQFSCGGQYEDSPGARLSQPQSNGAEDSSFVIDYLSYGDSQLLSWQVLSRFILHSQDMTRAPMASKFPYRSSYNDLTSSFIYSVLCEEFDGVGICS
jgi:hypothetical protein